MSFFGRLWRGDVSFAVTFWVFGVLGTLAFSFVKVFVFLSAMISEMLKAGSTPEEMMANFNPQAFVEGVIAFTPGFVVFAIAELVYFIFMTVAIWRSGTKYEGAKIWPILAKIILVLSWIGYIRDYYFALGA